MTADVRTIVLGSTVHEESAGALTACGKKIGNAYSGWRHPLTPSGASFPINCAGCITARKEAEDYMEGL